MKKKENLPEPIIIGIDPGTRITGYGLIRIRDKKPELVTCGVIRMERSYLSHADKLKRIFERILSIIDEFKPNVLAIEAPFYAKNVQAMLKLGRAQGVCIAAGMVRNLPIFEYAPRKVKSSVTGYGTASKEQVAGVLARILPGLPPVESDGLFDAHDAVAVALCHFYQNRVELPTAATSSSGKTRGGWGAFVAENPDRVKKP